ncbi:MAG: hypothetical protein N2321_09890 [Melioribacteraceae bacterium]|nr:hypothetical protein [Melioribacteraceae bacterium]
MKYKFLILLVLSFLLSCSSKKDIENLINRNYEQYIISITNTSLKFNLDKIDKNILILLHNRIKKEEITKKLNINDSTWNDRINHLFGNSLIKKKDEIFLPTFFILDNENGNSLIKFTDSLGNELSIITQDRLKQIKEESAKIFPLTKYSFNDISFFILGAIVNDFLQLNNFQNEFIKSFVPQRGNERFYFALIENDNSKYFSPGIYEINIYNYPNFQFVTFSSNKFDYNIPTLPTSDLVKLFDKNKQTNDSIFQLNIINELIKFVEINNYKPSQNISEGLKTLQIIKNNKSTIPVIHNRNFNDLYKITNIIKPDLINYFESRQTLFLKKYLNSDFKDEVSYKEWMIWIYKLISAKAINSLIEKKIINKPIVSSSLIIKK